MADSDVIGDVSGVLERLLTDAIEYAHVPPQPIAGVHDLRGTIPTPRLLTLFLYEISRDPGMRNRRQARRKIDTLGRPLTWAIRRLVAGTRS